MSKNATMKLGDYFKLIKPKYEFLKVTPDTSIRNYDSANIARAIQGMNKSILQRIKRDCKTWNIEVPPKASFFMDIKKSSTEFYFIVPNLYRSLFEEKITETWNMVTIEEVDSIPQFSTRALNYQLQYKNEDALSLDCNKKCNEPLTSILGVLDIMHENDRVGVFYNFIPMNQRGWRAKFEKTMKRYQNNECLLRNTFSLEFIVSTILSLVKDILSGIGEGINEALRKEKAENMFELAITKLMISEKSELSKDTLSKKDETILDTQIFVQSDSENLVRRTNNALSVAQSFKTLTADNELVAKQFDYPIYYDTFKVGGAEVNKMSVNEIQNLLELPGRTLLDRFRNIKKIDVLESPLPEELQDGHMCIGDVSYKGKKFRAYLSNDKEYKCLTLCVVAPTRAGKSTLLANLVVNAIENNECAIIPDWIENCGLSDEIKKAIIKRNGQFLEIDLSKPETIQGIGYNEIRNNPNDVDGFETYRNAKAQTTMFSSFINSVNDDDKTLSAKMDRYLESACLVVFIQGGSVKDVFSVLQNFDFRKKYIDNIPENQLERMDEFIATLQELDDKKKGSDDVTGTKYNLIAGIMDRLHKIKKNAYMELMLKKSCQGNIDLVTEMQENQAIFIKMPEHMFATEEERDIYTTYWMGKIWLALQVRAWLIEDKELRKKVNIITDELYQVPNAQTFIKSKVSQCAKFRGKFIISCMYLQQISIIREELRSANTSYMLISGCDKKNYNELKEELYPYTVEDLLKLPRYSSINLIKYSDGYARFVTELPKPIK